MSNVKAGDLAVIVRDSAHTQEKTGGLIVAVLRRAAQGVQRMPDGKDARCSTTNAWVIEFDREISVLTVFGNWRRTKYAVCDDQHLRPILPPPGTVTDSEVLELYSPKQREHA